MGFYGNLTNTARTQFQFDKIYPNRYSMERNINTDGIYLGRYVLVEYDADIHEDNIIVAYYSNKKFYTTIDLTQEFMYNTFTPVPTGVNQNNFSQYYMEENGFHYPANGYDTDAGYFSFDGPHALADGVELNEIIQTRSITGALTGQFWKCTGADNEGHAVFEEITEVVENNFITNYNIDITHFGPRQPEGAYSRAWDSTVWQKIYAEGEVKYIMIAELNSAAPSFSMDYDAPTQTPLAPHVDASSSNNVYRVHLQPTWGFRIKEEPDEEKSDTKVFHITSTYDAKTNQINDVAKEVNGAIYLNKPGFEIEASNKDNSTNYITITPTGQSGLNYGNHKGYFKTRDTKYQDNKTYYTYNPDFKTYNAYGSYSVGADIDVVLYEFGEYPPYDINELDVHVPAFGNAVADFYNLMYGYDATNNNLRYRDTDWKYYTAEGRDPVDLTIGGMTFNRKTLAGTINYLHQLEGMILYNIDSVPTEEEVQNLSSEYIYRIPALNSYDKDKYYYRRQTYAFDTDAVGYTYTKVDTNTTGYIPNCYFTLNSGATLNPNNLQKDIGNNSYNSNKDYYIRTLTGPTYTSIGFLVDYVRDKYYYKVGSDYLRDKSYDFSEDRTYYDCDQSFRYRVVTSEELQGAVNWDHHYFKQVPSNYTNTYPNAINGLVEIGWTAIDRATESTYQEGRNYYILTDTWRLIELRDYVVGDDIPADLNVVLRNVDFQDRDRHVNELTIPQGLSGGSIYIDNGVTFKASYLPNTYWYRSNGRSIQLDVGGPTYTVYNYQQDPNNTYTLNRNYYDVNPSKLDEPRFYRANQFIYFDEDDGEHSPFTPENRNEVLQQHSHIDTFDYPTLNRFYWTYVLGDPIYMYDYITGGLIYVQPVTDCVRVNVISITGQYRYIDPETFSPAITPETPTFRYYYKLPTETVYKPVYSPNQDIWTSSNLSKFEFYSLDLDLTTYYRNEDFYVANRYYYFNQSEDLILDSNLTYDYQNSYYLLPKNEETGILNCMTEVKFYRPDTYYYRMGNAYAIDNARLTTTNREYFEKDTYRVYEDLLQYYTKGAAWSDNIPVVPCTITLGKTSAWYEFQEIDEIGTDTNSLNNLILKFNKMLGENDKVIRNPRSVQGSLNLHNDVLNRLDTNVEANKIVVTDSYGRFTTFDLTIDQLNALKALVN